MAPGGPIQPHSRLIDPATIQSVRLIAAAAFLLAALTSGLYFTGSGANLVILALAMAALLAALACVGPVGIARTLDDNPWGPGLALGMLAYLVIAYRLSVSPDSSFAASWVLASGPLVFVCGSAVVRDPSSFRAITLCIGAVVTALAMYSAIRFVLFGERAHEPLVDPNNYSTLLYLTWIPLVHWYLARGWRGRTSSGGVMAVVLASSFVLLLAIIATRSRTSLLIVAGAFAVWIACAAAWRVSWTGLLANGVAAGAAFVVAGIVNSLTDASAKGLEFGGGLSTREELVRAALAMFGQHPMGVGVFCFPLLYPMFRSTLEQETAGLFVHNDYVQLLAEGGVPMLILLLVFVAAVLVRGWKLARLGPSDTRFEQLGVALALAACGAHASVNFVFYSLPLCILVGLLAASLFAIPLGGVSKVRNSRGVPRIAIIGMICLGWIMWLYLALDVAIVGVFQNQPTLGLASPIRANEHRMLEFARIAQRLNGNRGVPALGEAVLLYRATREEPDSKYLREQTYEQFHRALSVDPWNSLGYVRFAQFLEEFPQQGGPAPGESTEQLLVSAISVDRLFVPALDALLEHYAATSQEPKGYALLRNVVYPWMPTLRRNDPDATRRYFDLLEKFASAGGDSKFLDELKERRAQINQIVPRPQIYRSS
jgi:O-antigen ligase